MIMKKTMRRIAMLMLVLALVVTGSVTVFADEQKAEGSLKVEVKLDGLKATVTWGGLTPKGSDPIEYDVTAKRDGTQFDKIVKTTATSKTYDIEYSHKYAFTVAAFVGETKVGEETVELAPDKEAAMIAKYGYYHGQNATKIPVLTYHMVMSNKQKSKGKYRRSSLAVSQSTFDKQMKYLVNKGYRFVNCDEFYLWYTGKINLPPRSVLITFDDGYVGVAKYALPVLQKYNIKGTTFIVGTRTVKNKKNTIKYNQLLQLRASQDNLEFQSHTYNLHKKFSKNGEYQKVMNDAAKQKAVFGFDYLAYPYGRNTAGMRQAYADSGIKLAFTYGKNGYATRNQNIYQIRRIKVDGRKSFSAFTKWVK